MTSLDARRAMRFPVRLACHVASPSQTLDELPGVTLNMSRSGLLATFEEREFLQFLPELGGTVRVIVELPGSTSLPRRCLECMGHVVRVEQGPASRQIAFEIERLEFRDSASAPHDENPIPESIQ
jgi:hypothetical protein